MIDTLYYGDKPCSCCGGQLENSGIEFSPEVLRGFLEKIYEGFDTSSEIEPTMWRELLKTMNEASVEGLVASGHTTHEQSFLRALRHSNEVFSAFKSHSMGSLMQERLLDDKGKLRPFDEWKQSVGGIAKHYLGAWLKTEYDTAVLRAHQAADWQEFERNRDILPNLRWMPTTSPTPEEAHKGYWSSGLTLPLDHPFWADNHPANRWNCKCSLEATSEPASNGEIPDAPKAQAGLEENPRHGHTFSDKHPYFPSSCGACPFYSKGKSKARNLFERVLDNRTKDCHNCPYVNSAIDRAKIAEGEVYIKSKEYGDRLLISIKADPADLEDNKRVAKALLESFPEMQVKIRAHIRVKGHKNPELEINGLIADNKKIESEKGVTSAFKKAIKQGCKAVVIDLDAHVKRLRTNDLKKYLRNRTNDLPGDIDQCYVVYQGHAVGISSHQEKDIQEALQMLKKKTSE